MKCHNFLNFNLTFQEINPVAKLKLQLTLPEVQSFQQCIFFQTNDILMGLKGRQKGSRMHMIF